MGTSSGAFVADSDAVSAGSKLEVSEADVFCKGMAAHTSSEADVSLAADVSVGWARPVTA